MIQLLDHTFILFIVTELILLSQYQLSNLFFFQQIKCLLPMLTGCLARCSSPGYLAEQREFYKNVLSYFYEMLIYDFLCSVIISIEDLEPVFREFGRLKDGKHFNEYLQITS